MKDGGTNDPDFGREIDWVSGLPLVSTEPKKAGLNNIADLMLHWLKREGILLHQPRHEFLCVTSIFVYQPIDFECLAKVVRVEAFPRLSEPRLQGRCHNGVPMLRPRAMTRSRPVQPHCRVHPPMKSKESIRHST